MGWYSPSWTHRVKITVDHTKVGATLTNYPVFVNLANLPAGFWSSVLNGGGDIRVTKSDGTTELAREVVTCKTAGSTGEIHFNADSLSSAADTDFYIYYGNAGASEPAANATYGKYNTWDANYSGVYHLEANSNDSTSNQINGTDTSMSYGAGKVGQGGIFGGSGYIDLGVSHLLTTVTLEAWANITSFASYRALFGRTNGGVPASYELRADITSGTREFIRGDAGGNSAFAANTAASTGSFQLWQATGSGSSWAHYLNGAADGTVTNGVTLGNGTNIHCMLGAQTAAGAIPMLGTMDEMRISSIARASTWLSTCYNNQNNPATFYTVGAQENAPANFSKSWFIGQAIKRSNFY